MTKEIPLTQGQVAVVDDWNYEYLSQWKWHANWNIYTKSYYAARNVGKRPNQRVLFMHRDIMKTPKGLDCDHINHDTLCNLEENLRNATRSQNRMNSRMRSDNSLGVKNVVRHGKSFQVSVTVNGVTRFCGTFRDLESAIIERDRVVNELHGEFANISDK